MSITAALDALYRERDRLDAERAKLDDAITALEGISGTPSSQTASVATKKKDGRSAPKPPIACPFCDETAKGMAGMAAHVRGSHPDRYPDAYEEWKRGRG